VLYLVDRLLKIISNRLTRADFGFTAEFRCFRLVSFVSQPDGLLYSERFSKIPLTEHDQTGVYHNTVIVRMPFSQARLFLRLGTNYRLLCCIHHCPFDVDILSLCLTFESLEHD